MPLILAKFTLSLRMSFNLSSSLLIRPNQRKIHWPYSLRFLILRRSTQPGAASSATNHVWSRGAQYSRLRADRIRVCPIRSTKDRTRFLSSASRTYTTAASSHLYPRPIGLGSRPSLHLLLRRVMRFVEDSVKNLRSWDELSKDSGRRRESYI